jgi:Flp pilus assembly protein TadG
MFVSRKNRVQRRGVATLEFAFIAPVLFLLLYGLLAGSLAVFRYQQISSLARDCARWASTHGASWAQANNGGKLTTQSDVFTKVLEQRAFVFDTAKLKSSSTVTWDDGSQAPITSTSMRNRVHVTLKYSLGAENFPLVGALLSGITLTSTAERDLSF